MRPAPRIRPRELLTRGWLEPNGGHEFEISPVGETGIGLLLNSDQVEQLERAIANWKQKVVFEDGRSDRPIYNRRPFEVA